MSGAERDLLLLSDSLDIADPGDRLVRRVTERIVTAPTPAHRRRVRRVRAAVAAMVLTAAAIPVAPAVADWLGVGGIEVRQVPVPPRLPEARSAGELGRAVSLGEAEAAFGRALAVPAAMGEPEAVWLEERSAAPIVTLDYGEVLVTQFRVPLARREVTLGKVVGPGVTVEEASVNGEPALWLEGAHGILLQDATYVPMRRSANALVWERGGVTFRVETAGDLADAMVVALSLR